MTIMNDVTEASNGSRPRIGPVRSGNLFRGALAALLATAALQGCSDTGKVAELTVDSAKTAVTRTAKSAGADRLVTIGGSVTEIVHMLGRTDRIVAVDQSSTYPEQIQKLPQVGYQRTLTAEGVLSLNPSTIVATDESGPPAAIEQLKGSGVPLILIPSKEYSIEGARAKIRAVASAVGGSADALIDSLDRSEKELTALLATTRSKPKVLFLYSRGGAGGLHVSGEGTAADAAIKLAGGVNAVSGYDGYKPLSAEAAVAAAPDVILLPSRGLQMAGGLDALLSQNGLAGTPAGRARRVVAMDDLYLLGFGPRTGRALMDLARQIHPELAAGGSHAQ